MKQTEIRRADARDIPGIMNLLVQVDLVHHAIRPDLFKGPATKYTEEELKALLADDSTPVFVCADESGQVLGHCFCVFKQLKSDNVLTDIKSLYIDDLCVDSQARGRGVGKILYDYALGFAKSIGCHNLTLHVWDKNPGARAFYEKMGMGVQQTTMEVIL